MRIPLYNIVIKPAAKYLNCTPALIVAGILLSIPIGAAVIEGNVDNFFDPLVVFFYLGLCAIIIVANYFIDSDFLKKPSEWEE
jgi:hypothetical protein